MSRSPTIRTYRGFGLRVTSPISLPGFSRVAADSAQPADVQIRLASIPLVGEPVDGTRFRCLPDGAVLLERTDVGRFLVQNGRQIFVDLSPTASERDVTPYLLGTALGALLHQRDMTPLHANAIAVDGRAVAFAGRSGAGKSTLAAHFHRAGYDVFCDDLCVVSIRDGDSPCVWPGVRRIKLYPDAFNMISSGSVPPDLAIDGTGKLHLPLADDAALRPLPLKALYLLQSSQDGEPGIIERLEGIAAVRAVVSQIYRQDTLAAMGVMPRAFGHAAALVRAVPIYRATRRWGADVFHAEADKLKRHFCDNV